MEKKKLTKIKIWDETYCAPHVGNLVNHVVNIFNNNNLKKINYIDIGANVGKVYELLNNDIPVKNVWMIEASPTLYEYSKKKFKKDSNVKIYNYAVYNTNGIIDFNESSMEHQFIHNEDGFNFGLSSIGAYTNSKKVESIKISDFILDDKKILKKVNFIKIDTESVDLEILEDLLSVVDKFETLPLIIFEINYFVKGHPQSWAQKILNKFTKKGYKKINLKECGGDGVLIPQKFN
jgi:FkbM family methyltransferase